MTQIEGSTDFMRALDVAWAAGLFEGEGCWCVTHPSPTQTQMQVRLAMTDRDVVERFATVMGCGTVRTRDHDAHQAKGWKPLHEWYVYEAAKVREVIALLAPHMGTRRRAKAEEVLAAGAGILPYGTKRTHCRKGHTYAGDNVIVEHTMRHGEPYTARRCRECRRAQSRERMRRVNGADPARYRVTT